MNDLKTIKMSLTYSQCPNKREGTGVEWSQDWEMLKIITQPAKVKMRCTFLSL